MFKGMIAPIIIAERLEEFPVTFESGWQYISVPDGYKSEVAMGQLNKRLTDVSAFSKDRLIFKVIPTLAGFGTLETIILAVFR
jgi:hypothetical protein